MQPSEEDIAWFKSTFHPVPKPVLPEDCIDYNIYLISADSDSSNDSALRLELRNVQKYANDLQKQWLKGYIWQRQGFSLELIKEDGEVGVCYSEPAKISLTGNAGLSSLKGRTEFGDSIEDEWVIVWILRELTRKFDKIWIKVSDSDGEFLLIEASGTIPEWLEPDVAENRVWVNNGQLKILKPGRTSKSSKQTSETLSLRDAHQIMLKDPKRIMHSTSIEEEAFYRLRNYPAQIQDNMHHALVKLPRKVAFLLLQRPAYISSAIEAFYLRDPIALKLLQKGSDKELQFPPKDLVTLSIKFPKVGYAQIKSQDFTVPPAWKSVMPSTSDVPTHSRVNIGMKVTCGFEMLVSDQQYQDKQTVREMKIILGDLETGDDSLPSDAEIEKIDAREDNDDWLKIDFEDLEHELSGKSRSGANSKKPGFGDKAAQENLQRIVKQFEDFLNNDSEMHRESGTFDDSSDLDDNDANDDELADESDSGEDKDASFDEEEFTKMMQEMMGMPPDVMKEIMSGTIDALSEGRSGKVSDEVRQRAMAKVQEIDSNDEDIEDMKQMESELRASGALNLNSSRSKHQSLQQAHQDGNAEDSEDDHDLQDLDAEFAHNIIQSFKSSGGMGGPAARLMSMMNNSATDAGSSKPRSTKQ